MKTIWDGDPLAPDVKSILSSKFHFFFFSLLPRSWFCHPTLFVQTATQFSRFSKVSRLFCGHFFLSKGSIMFLTNWMYCKDNSVWELIPQWKEARFRDLPLTANEENKAWNFKTKIDDWYWNSNWLKARFLNLIWGHVGGWGDGGTTMGKTDWKTGLKHPLESDCRTRVSRSIFKLTVERGCPGVF